MKKNSALLFYSGTLISSIGSMAFSICLLAFMIKDGHSLFDVSLILGLSRLIPVAISTFWGQLADRLPPRLTVVATEFLAAAMSVGILLSWNHGKAAYWHLLTFCVLKACVVIFQAGSRAKITKLLSDDTCASNSKNAVWYNKATQGATLFAGLLAWVIIENFDFQTAVFIDLISFIVNGIFIYLISVKADSDQIDVEREPFYKKIIDFYRYNPRAAVLDFALCVSMMGTVSFMARLSGQDQKWNALFMAGYGFCVLVCRNY